MSAESARLVPVIQAFDEGRRIKR